MAGELLASGRVLFSGLRRGTSKGGSEYVLAECAWLGGKDALRVDKTQEGVLASCKPGSEVDIVLAIGSRDREGRVQWSLRSISPVGNGPGGK